MTNDTGTVLATEEGTPEVAPATEAAPAAAPTTEAPATEATEGEQADEPASTVAASAAEPLDNKLKLHTPSRAKVTENVTRLMDQLGGQTKRTHSMREGIFKMLSEGEGKFSPGQEAFFTRFAANLQYIGTQAATGLGLLNGSITVDDDGDTV